MALTFFGAYRGPAFASTHADDHGARPGQADDHAHGGHGHWHGPHESPKAMTVPLMVLAVGAIFAGFLNMPAFVPGGGAFSKFLEPSLTAHAVASHPAEAGAPRLDAHAADALHGADAAEAHAPMAPPAAAADAHGAVAEHGAEGGHHISVGAEIALMVFSVLVALAGILFARHIYLTRPEASVALARRFPGAHRVLLNKYYVDEFYGATFIGATFAAARGSWLFDRTVVDGAVNGTGWLTRTTSWISSLVDKHAVDGLVNLVAGLFGEASHGFRRLQTGLIQNSALLMLVGVFAFVSAYMLWR
jgi:NADH-quinone oxidoreductase subunit L